MNWKETCVKKIQNEFSKERVLVIGDVMVDEYIIGKVRRISPEAPVPVLDYQERKLEAGGASNVAHNMHGLGAEVAIAGTAAADEAGIWLRKHFMEMKIDISCLIEEKGRPTTIKTRYATKGQQLLRMDNENPKGIKKSTEKEIYTFLKKNISRFDAVVLSDYKKGVLESEDFVEKIITLCNENGVIVSVDSKNRNIHIFANADFVKPNNLELEEAVGIHIEDDKTFELAGRKYLTDSGTKALVVTRGSKGISVFEPDRKRADYAAKDVQVYDVCGAGDTVISTITMGMGAGLSIGDSVKLANLAAGVVINKVGTAAITVPELLRGIYEK